MSFLKKEEVFFHLGRLLSRMTLLGSVKVKYHGPVHKPVIYVANHPSTLDPYFVIGSLKHPVHILITEHIFTIPIVGFILRHAGHVKVENGKGKAAYLSARRLLKQGKSLLIFPEGMVSSDKTRVNQLHTGAVRLAMETHAPIVPLGIYLNPSKIKKHTIYFGKNREVGNWYSNGIYGITFGKKISFIGDTQNRDEVRRQCELLRKELEDQVSVSSNWIQKEGFDGEVKPTILSLFVYFFRMHFAYANWINS